MVERRNQHYVPQHYLRAWSTDEKLNVLPLSTGETFRETTRSVCSRNYFYGNPPTVETELANLDGHHANPVRELRRGDELTDLSDQYVKLILSFITTQRSRTKATKEDILGGEDFLRDAVKDDMEADRFRDRITWTSDLNEKEKVDTLVDISLLGTHYYIITLGIFGYIGIEDLQGVMLCNVTDREFIISDAPVVLDNPRYKPEYGTVPVGLGNRGLQIFCPISPSRVLLLYDPQVYRFDHNSKKQVLIKSPDVVDELNLLQFHNAENIVMFDSNEDYIQDLHDRINEARRREEITMSLQTETKVREEVDNVPAYQAPKLSPSLPNCTTMTYLPYEKRRQRCQTQECQNLVHRIFNEAVAPDVAIIYGIRFFEEQLGL